MLRAEEIQSKQSSREALRKLGQETIRELETEKGILASGREEIYGCVFGRDSLITSLHLLRAYQRSEDLHYLALVKKVLLNLADLQGKEVNIESGEEPGKIIHEYRESDHEHLTARGERPWHVYEDGTMKIYDSVDSTPLFLIAVAKYCELSRDETFFKEIMPHVELGLEWMLGNTSLSKYGFLTYDFPEERKCGGLLTQSWMDSHESLFAEDGSKIMFPIAPVEVQGYAHLAMRLWGEELRESHASLSLRLDMRADKMKVEFNKLFVRNTPEFKVAYAVDGQGKVLLSKRSSPGHLLWMGLQAEPHANFSILEPIFVPKLVAWILSEDLFEPEAGIRTLSIDSREYAPNSYHNGSIWPHDNAVIAEGLENFGYEGEASAVRSALVNAWSFFETPIELFVYDGGFREYESSTGQKACKSQAWSAASMVAEL